MKRTTRDILAACGLAMLLAVAATSAASAQGMAPQGMAPVPGAADRPIRIRGTIEQVDGAAITVKARDGASMVVKLTDTGTVRGIVAVTLADVKAGSYIGVSAMPQPDGSQKAMHIHIFPETMRGTGEGFSQWDNVPGSTMTNAAVDNRVASVDGEVLTLKYKDGEKKIIVPAGIPIVTYLPGTKDELKPGAKVMINGARKQADGSYQAPNISVGRDGLTPPM
ncbi:MAG: hypothetical protein JWN71_2690 [Xanthobacteraceae bacterium]|jgi:hypothetical protein|nr:hypothetical protein [Xanthobacteraceae bacterium]